MSVVSILKKLASPDLVEQQDGLDALAEFSIAPRDGARLLRAAVRQYPNEDDGTINVSESLLDALSRNPKPEYIPVIEEVYDELKMKNRAREAALRILTELKTPESIRLFVQLLRRPSSRSIELMSVVVPLRDPGGISGDLIPTLVEAIPSIQSVGLGPLYSTLLDFVESGKLNLDEQDKFACTCVRRAEELLGSMEGDFKTYSSVLDRIEPSSGSKGIPSRVQPLFDELGVLVDLIGHVKGTSVDSALRKALNTGSIRLRIFAVGSLLRSGKDVQDSVLEDLGGTPAGRALLWMVLEKSKQLNRFPEKYNNQRDLAEADMVKWLQWPTEFGCAPRDIQVLAIVRTLEGMDSRTFYFFRFRHPAFEGGVWLVGVAGPYPLSGSPMLEGSITFSKFEPLKSKTLDAHVRTFIEEPIPYRVLSGPTDE